jgi:hypothetical protein
MDEPERRLESDLSALANRLRTDDAFADELYCALCNSDWRHDDGTEWSGSWRYSAGVMAELGWHGTGHGSELRLIDFRTGGSKVWRDGQWVDPDDDTG